MGDVAAAPPDAVVVEVAGCAAVVSVPAVPVPSVDVVVEPVLAVSLLDCVLLVEDVLVDVLLVEVGLVDVLPKVLDVLDAPPISGSALTPAPPVKGVLVDVPVNGLVDAPVKSVGGAGIVVNVGTVGTTGIGASTTGGGVGGGVGATAVVIDSVPLK